MNTVESEFRLRRTSARQGLMVDSVPTPGLAGCCRYGQVRFTSFHMISHHFFKKNVVRAYGHQPHLPSWRAGDRPQRHGDTEGAGARVRAACAGCRSGRCGWSATQLPPIKGGRVIRPDPSESECRIFLHAEPGSKSNQSTSVRPPGATGPALPALLLSA